MLECATYIILIDANPFQYTQIEIPEITEPGPPRQRHCRRVAAVARGDGQNFTNGFNPSPLLPPLSYHYTPNTSTVNLVSVFVLIFYLHCAL